MGLDKGLVDLCRKGVLPGESCTASRNLLTPGEAFSSWVGLQSLKM